MNRTITLLHAVMLCGLSAALHAQGPEATVLQGATILTVSKGTIENGSLVIRGGKIAAVGPNLAVPKGARVIDATGRYVLPGIIDCHSHMAIHVGNESGVPVTSMVSIEDVLEPEDITIYRALSGGVTTANILHGSSNPISASAARLHDRNLCHGDPAPEADIDIGSRQTLAVSIAPVVTKHIGVLLEVQQKR